MDVTKAYALVKRHKPAYKLLECLEFDEFYAFFFVPEDYDGEAVAGAYDTVNKKTGLISTFNPTDNLALYMRSKVIEIQEALKVLLIKNVISCRTYSLNMEICVDGYELENGITVQYLEGKWLDAEGREYLEVTTIDGELVCFEEI